MLRFAVTIFLSAFLLFQVQPMLGKYILPWFGGGASIWTTCMLFFQVGLLGGYLYAHLLGKLVPRAVQGFVHLALLAVSLVASLVFLPNFDDWKPDPGGEPISGILLLLLINIGAPFLLLSATGPLLQSWFSRSYPGRSPYRLYALSNIASLLALLSYPFLVEPSLRLAQQVDIWTWGHLAFVVCCGWCAIRFSLGRDVAEASSPATDDTPALSSLAAAQQQLAANEPPPTPVTPVTVLLWLGLAACGSAMLLATTNQLCQEVASVPFLWIVPLTLYLLSFIICFDSPRWYDRTAFGVFLLFMVPWACIALFMGVEAPLYVQVLIYTIVLFACCMTCHGELVRAKPHPRHLTLFYLMVACGGALGGVMVGLVAPLLFWGLWEYHLALGCCCLLTLVAWYRDGFVLGGQLLPRPVVWVVLLIGFLGLEAALAYHIYRPSRGTVFMTRNFYGAFRLVLAREDFVQRNEKQEDIRTRERILRLVHGRIDHGFQFLARDKSNIPTSYYADNSGVGLAIRVCREQRQTGLRIGVVGLGTGTLAAQGRTGDVIQFYEINEAVKKLSWGKRVSFFYVRNSAAQVDVKLGDARIRMEKELADARSRKKKGQQGLKRYDVLAIDAFSSDAIPIHLLTKECADVYWQHLKPDGVLALHVSNRFLDLEPICRALAREAARTPKGGVAQRPGCRALLVDSEANNQGGGGSSWVLLTNNRQFIGAEEVAGAVTPWPKDDPVPPPWTDDFHSLWQVLKWWWW